MIIKKGDYAFCGEDLKPHRWALKIGGDVMPSRWFKTAKPADKEVVLERLSYLDFMTRQDATPDLWKKLGRPKCYFVADNGSFATMWPRPDKDYELVQLPDEEVVA